MKSVVEKLPQAQKALLFVLPVLYLIAGGYFRNLLGNISLRTCDPEYIYYMSGLTLADGTFKLGHVDNPGTPLQILMALVFRIVWLLRGAKAPFVEDVLLHPDLYLSVTSLLIASLTGALIYYAGKKTFQYTGSVLSAIVVQTAPFLPVIWYDLIGRVTPELIMPFPVMLLMVMVIKVYYQEVQTNRSHVLLFALIAAFGLSIKLTFLPVWLIPFLFLKGWKQKAAFLGLAVLLFFVIAFPVSLRLGVFWGWVKDLFLHSGQHGGGEKNIIDFIALKANLSQLMQLEKTFFYLFMFATAGFLFYLAFFRKKVEKRITTLSLSVIATILVQLLMVGKHYAHHYFIPVLMLSPLLLLIIAETIKKFSTRKVTIVLIKLGILLCLFWNVNNHRYWLPIKTEAMGNDIESRLPTWHFVNTIDTDNNYKIITSQNYGCPFIEYTLTYSLAWSNYDKRLEYAPILDKLYPHTFNYFTWDNSLRFWVEDFDAQRIIDSGKKLYLYIERDEEVLFEKTMEKLAEVSPSKFTAARELLYRNPATTEVIYQLFLYTEGVE